jgi:hypothetical protein
VRYEVRCTNRECYLREGVLYADLAAAEVLAWAHEQRWVEDVEAHTVVLKDLNHPVSKPQAATGDKGGGNG